MHESAIRILPENLANKIAAGEVVERPASIIKELVENSIDANAKSISIDLVNGGKRSIRITDDGTGMNRDDSLLAFERHATSKIREDEDLFAINTLGFRGEALPSIASVSKISMTTSTGNPGDGVTVFLEGGVIRDVREAAHPRGTSLKVESLFFNTPARKKFLKTNETELGHISNIAIREALARPGVSFKLSHNQRSLIEAPGHSKLLPRIMDLFGRELLNDLIHIKNEDNGMEVEGYISRPSYHRSGRESLYFYINQRFVKDKLISHAVMEAYRTLIPKGRTPTVFLFLKLDPASVDVNVHPSKTEVRFAEQNKVHDFVMGTIQEGLNRGNGKLRYGGAPVPSPAHEVREPDPTPIVSRDPQGSWSAPPASYVPNDKPVSRESRDQNTGGFSHKAGHKKAPGRYTTALPSPSILDASAIGYSDFRPIGQIDRSYIVLESKRGMILIDQHTAHERILYERFLKEKRKKSVEVQRLLFPINLEFTKGEILLLEPVLNELKGLGFELELFGGNTLLARSVPAILSGKDCSSLVRDLCDKLASHGKGASFEEMAGDIISLMACHAAVRAGEALKQEEINAILEDLKKTNRPFTCPHGRPIALFFDISQIKKWFFR